MEILPESTSNNSDVGWSSRNQRWRRRYLIPAESDSLPHAHTQSRKTYYKHQVPSIKKAQDLKTKTSAISDIKDPSSETKLQGRFLESFLDDAKYEHVGQDTRSQDGKDDKDRQGKDLKILEQKPKSKRKKAQDQRSHSMKEQAYNKDKDQEQDSRTQCRSNLKKSKTML
ncbi:hypothetical protein Tco_1469398 [Tanacetum coccineum]